MYDKFKHRIHTNFLALAGYPLMWYIYESIQCFIDAPITSHGFKDPTAFEFLTILVFIPYMFLTLFIALILFMIGFVYKKIKRTEYKEKQNNLMYNIFFNTGFSLYLLFTIFFIFYFSYILIINIFNLV